MVKQKKFGTAILFILLALLPLASAYMPATHKELMDSALSTAPSSPVGQVVSKHYDDYIACETMTDFTLFYYFDQGFASIGKEYRFTHNQNLCTAMVTLSSDESELACAYGVCAHHAADSISHNVLVPSSIRTSGLPNAIIHIFAEEKVDDKIGTLDDKKAISNALLTAGKKHKEFFRKAVVNMDGVASDKFDSAYDGFIQQVVGSTKFTPGFAGFIGIPMSIHLAFLVVFALGFAGLAYFVRNKPKNFYASILKGLSLFVTVLIVVVYVFFFAGKLWWAFQTVSTPISAVTPVINMESTNNMATANLVSFMNMGSSYVLTLPDPSGRDSLAKADSEVLWKTYLMVALLAGLILYVGYKAFR